MSEEKTVVRGNPIIPGAPIPSIVRMSMVPPPPPPIEKKDGERVEKEGEKKSKVTPLPSPSTPIEKGVGKIVEEEMDVEPKGIVVIKVFENSPYEVEFTGIITGSEIDIAWKAMMKEYRVWKHTLFKKQTTDGGV